MAIKTTVKHQFFDDNGDPLNGGKVYFYQPGTSTPKDTYTTSAGDVANANPVILNSRGEADIFTDGLYKIDLKTSANVQVTGYPVDNVGAGSSNNDASMRWCGTATGTANALVLSPTTSITAYAIGQSFVFKASSSSNTSTTTVAISGLSAIAVQASLSACNGGEIIANHIYVLVLDTLTTAQVKEFDSVTDTSGGSFTTLTATGDAGLATTKKLYLDGIAMTGNTYIVESSADVMDLYAGGAKTLSLNATAAAVVGVITATTGVTVRPATASHGYATLEPGTAGASGYLSIYSHTGGTRQGYIGSSATNAAGDSGTLNYGAGTHAFAGALSVTTSITGSTLVSTVATGTAPLTVSSTTEVANLKAATATLATTATTATTATNLSGGTVAATTISASGVITSTVATGTAPLTVSSTTEVANLKAATATTASNTGGKTTIASATTPDIFATSVGTLIDYTGTATCTGFVAAPQAGATKELYCADACLFTAGANLLIEGIPSGRTVTLAAGASVKVTAITTTQFKITYSLSGTFTATGTGFTVNPTVTAAFSITNGIACISIPSGFLMGTSNATTFTVTGLPSCLVPSGNKWFPSIRALDNGAAISCIANIANGASVIDITLETGVFTASGDKRLENSEFVYRTSLN